MICMSEHADRKSADVYDDKIHHKIFHFGLRIIDADAWRALVFSRKIPVHYGGPVEYPHSLSWYINDPSGHEIEVSWTGGEELRFG